MSAGYSLAYRLGVRPWERAGRGGQEEFDALLDRELTDPPRSPGRALDLGCGRGQHSRELALRGWEVVGVDNVPQAVRAARAGGGDGVTFVEADVTALDPGLGVFDFFLDVGCFHGLNEAQRAAAAGCITDHAAPGATLLMLAFRPHGLPMLPAGIERADIEAAFDAWRVLAEQPADASGMPAPMRRTEPQFYRLGLTG